MTEKKEKENNGMREVVVPGEVIADGKDFLPGDWTMKNGEKIIATRLGVLDNTGKIVKVVPISGVYTPRRGNVVIGIIEDITMRGWITNIKAPYSAFLMLKECPMYVDESEMENVYGINDLVVAKIFSVKRTAIDLTTNGRGLGKVKDGIIIEINPHRVPRVIGKEGSMIKLIKMASNCEIVVGQNGLIWIKGEKIEDELFAKKAIEFVVDNTISEGLTEKVEEWLKKNGKNTKIKDIVQEKESSEEDSEEEGEKE